MRPAPPNGTIEYYEPSPVSSLHRIASIVDKFGNSLVFAYDDDLSLSDFPLLISITTHTDQPTATASEEPAPPRVISLAYDDQSRVVQISDYFQPVSSAGSAGAGPSSTDSSRLWQYLYDSAGDLIAVVGPTGLTTEYMYNSAFVPEALQHGLTTIVDPMGNIALENEYGMDPDDISYNRVIHQRQGDGMFLFDYYQVISDFELDYAVQDCPFAETLMVDRNGQQSLSVFNSVGNMLLRQEYLVQSGAPGLVTSRYSFNADGALLASLTPNQALTLYIYGRELYCDSVQDLPQEVQDNPTMQTRATFGNLLTIFKQSAEYDLYTLTENASIWGSIFPDPLSTFFFPAPEDIIQKYSYEPVYQQIQTISDPRLTTSPNPENVFDLGQPMTTYAYSPPADPTNPAPGTNVFLSEIQYPDGTTEGFEFDPCGRLLQRIDQEGRVVQFEYFGPTQGLMRGYLSRKDRGPIGNRGCHRLSGQLCRNSDDGYTTECRSESGALLRDL